MATSSRVPISLDYNHVEIDFSIKCNSDYYTGNNLYGVNYGVEFGWSSSPTLKSGTIITISDSFYYKSGNYNSNYSYAGMIKPNIQRNGANWHFYIKVDLADVYINSIALVP